MNYDKIFQDMVNNSEEGDSLLLHVCCCPCLTYCLTQLTKFRITLFFSNDNITNQAEYDKRLDEVRRFVARVMSGDTEIEHKHPIDIIVPQNAPGDFYERILGHEKDKEGGNRCRECYHLRLTKAYQYATIHHFKYFATTLSISPYKDSNCLNAIGESLAESGETKWLYSDFKKRGGYNKSIEMCNTYGIYRQHYCGCEYSIFQEKAEE